MLDIPLRHSGAPRLRESQVSNPDRLSLLCMRNAKARALPSDPMTVGIFPL
jgi:hypothetical protein